MKIRSVLGTGALLILSYAAVTGLHVHAVHATKLPASTPPLSAPTQAAPVAAAPIEWHVPEAKAQCYAFAQNDCGCVCAAGYADYNDCTTFGDCPDVSCYTDNTPCLCCSAQ